MGYAYVSGTRRLEGNVLADTSLGAVHALARLRANLNREVHCVLGLPIDAIDMAGAVKRVRDAAFKEERCFVSTPNLNFVMAARDDGAFRDSVLHSDLSLADGMPLVWLSRLLGIPIRERVSGAGLFENLLRHPGPPIKVYFFGGTDGAAQAACRQVNQINGGLKCVGCDTPGFGTVEQLSSKVHLEKINASGAQFVIVSLGAKKGQAWIQHNLWRLRPPVVCHLGAVVNFAAGAVQRAPSWIQRIGAEWLWRIKEEPALWRRYLGDGHALVQVYAMPVLLMLIARFVQKRPRMGNDEPSATLTSGTQRVTLALAGIWTQHNLSPLRRLLLEACASEIDLEVNLALATHLDSACIGLLMLAKGAISPPRKLTLSHVAPALADQIRLTGAGFLVDSGVHGEA